MLFSDFVSSGDTFENLHRSIFTIWQSPIFLNLSDPFCWLPHVVILFTVQQKVLDLIWNQRILFKVIDLILYKRCTQFYLDDITYKNKHGYVFNDWSNYKIAFQPTYSWVGHHLHPITIPSFFVIFKIFLLFFSNSVEIIKMLGRWINKNRAFNNFII